MFEVFQSQTRKLQRVTGCGVLIVSRTIIYERLFMNNLPISYVADVCQVIIISWLSLDPLLFLPSSLAGPNYRKGRGGKVSVLSVIFYGFLFLVREHKSQRESGNVIRKCMIKGWDAPSVTSLILRRTTQIIPFLGWYFCPLILRSGL